MNTPWPPNIELQGSIYMVRPVTLRKHAPVPHSIFIFDEDGAPVLTVHGPWASYPEALEVADGLLRRHVSPLPVDVFGSH